MKSIAYVLVPVLLIIFLLICSNTVLANGAPTAITPSNIGDILPVNNPDVSVINEKITYSSLMSRGKYRSMNSKIEYTLKNKSATAKNINVVFPFDSPLNYNNLEIKLNGKNLDSKILDNVDYFEAFKIERYRSEYGWRDPKVISFEFEIEGSQTASLVITYTHFSGFTENEFNFIYYLQPAKYWADYKDLSIVIELPDNYSLTSNLDFKLHKNNFLKKEYTFSSRTLPQSDLYFKVSQSGIRKIYYLFIITIIFFLIFFTAFLLKRKLSKKALLKTVE